MRLTIAAIGQLRQGPEAQMIKTYCERLAGIGRQIGLRGLSVEGFEAPNALTGTARQQKEAELLANAVPPGANVYVLDERGKSMTSKAFADDLGRIRDAGANDCVFLIGGADGHGPAVKALQQSGRAKVISFGQATWPHMLVRVMLCEQLYRAATIMSNHPYHRE
jgi:23S rRNA (pseudouridine1915-N3)-methyltransferase